MSWFLLKSDGNNLLKSDGGKIILSQAPDFTEVVAPLASKTTLEAIPVATFAGNNELEAHILETLGATAQLSCRVSVPILYSPDNEGQFISPITFVWYIPQDYFGEAVLSNIQIANDVGFSSIMHNRSTDLHADFEYFKDGNWIDYPVGGVPSSEYGFLARISLPLIQGIYYWRVRGGVIIST